MPREPKNQREWLLAETLCAERHGVPVMADGCDECRADIVRLVDGAPTSEAVDIKAVQDAIDDLLDIHAREDRKATQDAIIFLLSLYRSPVPPPAAPMPKVEQGDVEWLQHKLGRARHDETQEWVIDSNPMEYRKMVERVTALCEYALSQQGGGK